MNPENVNQPAAPENNPVAESYEQQFYDALEELDELNTELAELKQAQEKINNIEQRIARLHDYITRTEQHAEKLAVDHKEATTNMGKTTIDTIADSQGVPNPGQAEAAVDSTVYHNSQGQVFTNREDAINSDRPA